MGTLRAHMGWDTGFGGDSAPGSRTLATSGHMLRGPGLTRNAGYPDADACARHRRIAPSSLAPAAPGLVIAHLASWVGPLLRALGIELPQMGGPQAVLVWNWLAVLLLFVFMARVEHRPPRSIGLSRPSAENLCWGLGAQGLSLAVTVGTQSLVPPEAGPGSGTAILLALPILALAALVLTTAITEEIIWRGYTIEALGDLVGRRWLAALVSLVAFAAPHVAFFGPLWLLHHGSGAVLFTLLYLWRGNLWLSILAHGLGNAVILLPALGVGAA